ncbi:MFS transporter [Moraxella cuniculi]|uniref:MFS transporter n=1 Tax=Moraxella cuniculi TaxID=34061 RepID=UPI001300EC18|nr:MFS transporter [Moraxella cuniculi]
MQKLVTEGMIPFVMMFLVLQEGEFLAGAIAFAILALGTFFNGYGGKAVASQNIKNALIWGEFVQFIAVLLMAIFVNSIVFILLYLLKNVIFSYLVPFGEVFVFELTTNENRAVLYQLSGLMNGLAAPLGALLGGFFYSYGLNILIYVLSAFSFLIFLLYFFGFAQLSHNRLAGQSTDSQAKTPTKNNQFSRILDDKSATYLLLSSVFIHSLFFSLSQFLPAYLSGLNNGSQLLSFSRTISGVVVLVAGLALLGFIKKIARYTTMLWTTFLYGLLFVLLFLVIDNEYLFYMVSALVIVFYFVSVVGIKTIYANGIGDKNAGIYLSAFSLTGRAGNIIAALILMISGFVGYGGTVGILALFATLATGWLLLAKTA